MGDPQWLAYLDQVKTQIQGGSNPDFAARLTAILDAQETRIPPPPTNNPLLQGGGDNGRRSGGLLDLDNDALSVSGRGASAHFEKIPTDIPIHKFPYGEPGADLREYASRFRRAVKTVTNALTEERTDELCLMWFPLKLPDEAQSIYQGCEHKDSNWKLLIEELEELMEDPIIRRNWSRDLGAYKKPAGVSLQVYKANVLSYVHKYSPAVMNDPKSYKLECYNRFVHGLEFDWREAIDAGIPFGKETIERAYNQAIKYELRGKESKQVAFTGAAMTDQERNKHDKKRHQSSSHHRQSGQMCEVGDCSSTSEESDSSSSLSEEDLRAIQYADEDSDSEDIKARTKVMTESISKAVLEGMKGLSVKPKKGSSSNTASAGRSSGKSKSKR